MSNIPACVIVVCSLKVSIVQNQIFEDASMGLTADIAFGRQFRRRRERQMPTDLCFCRANSGKVIKISSIGWKTATLLCNKIFVHVLLTKLSHTIETWLFKGLFVFRYLICLIILRTWGVGRTLRIFIHAKGSLCFFNRSTTKKAKQSGTVAFHDSPSLGHISDISLHSEISVESKNYKTISVFYWLFVNFRKCDKAQLIKGCLSIQHTFNTGRRFFLASPHLSLPLVSILFRLCAFKMVAHYKL